MSVQHAVTQALQDKQDLAQASAELLLEHSKGGVKRDDWLDINEQAKRLQKLESLNGHTVEYYGDRLDSMQHQVFLKARRKADKVIETYVFNDSIPWYFSQYLKYWSATRWDLVTIYNNSPVETKAYTTQEQQAQKTIKRRKKNREHERAYIVLHEESTITCEETGITFTCKLPIPATSQAAKASNLSILHPLAFFNNVHEVIRQYYKTGIRLERELDPQVLAGMLLTIWKHKNMLICKDFQKANIFLSAATRETLSYAVRYFHNLPSTLMMPAISLHLDDAAVIKSVLRNTPLSSNQKATQEAEVFILNYIKACKGESVDDAASHIKLPKPNKDKAKVKIYSDPVVQQAKQVKSKTVEASELLDNLQKHTDKSQHQLLFSLIKTQIKGLVYLSEKAKSDLAHKIVTTFPSNSEALALSRIFADTATDKIEDDLFSFTQQLERDKQDWQAGKKKVDFMSLLQKKG